MARDRFELDVSIKIEHLAARKKRVERVRIYMVAMRRVIGPIGICVVRRQQLYSAAISCNAIEFGDERHHVRYVFDDVIGHDEVKFVVRKRVRKIAEIMDDIGVRARIIVQADSPFGLIGPAADIQDIGHLE